jgi:hypothetical protein
MAPAKGSNLPTAGADEYPAAFTAVIGRAAPSIGGGAAVTIPVRMPCAHAAFRWRSVGT